MSILKFIGNATKSGWTILAIAVGVFGNWDTIWSWFTPKRPSWVDWVSSHWPSWSGETWIIIALFIFLASSLVKAYSIYKDEVAKKAELRLQFESDRLKLKQELEQHARELWASRGIQSLTPIQLKITERTFENRLFKPMLDRMNQYDMLPALKKWISWHMPIIDGILEIQNLSGEPIRVRATGNIREATFPLQYKQITYVIQWQGLPDEDKILWPNWTAPLELDRWG